MDNLPLNNSSVNENMPPAAEPETSIAQQPENQDAISALTEERNNYQRKLEQEKSVRKQYENILSAIENKNRASDPLKAQYEQILKTKGQAEANLWLNQQQTQKSMAVQAENQATLSELKSKYNEICAVPEVRQAIEAYIKLDVDPSKSLKEQGFPEAIEYISSIYKAGYDQAFRLKNQNNEAKSRMGSSILSGMPSMNSGRAFSRAEIAAMDPETFAQNEKVIFEQMSKGLIR